MAEIILAEDSATQAIQIQYMLESAGHQVRLAKDGAQALDEIVNSPPDIVLTDMHMPERNGLELTEIVRERLPNVPVVLMTADGTEDLSFEALRKGAANYIPKHRLERDLVSTLDGICSMVQRRQSQVDVIRAVTSSTISYEFGNDRDFAASIVSHFEHELQSQDIDDETGRFQIVMALKEALANAMDHGNLELDSSMRDVGDGSGFDDLARERMTQEPYCSRRVYVTSEITKDKVTYTIRDQGPGFNPGDLPDPEDPENLMRAHGRGLLLIQSFMDDVSYNESGNEITLTKHRAS